MIGCFRRISCVFFSKLEQLKMEREVLKRGSRIVYLQIIASEIT